MPAREERTVPETSWNTSAPFSSVVASLEPVEEGAIPIERVHASFAFTTMSFESCSAHERVHDSSVQMPCRLTHLNTRMTLPFLFFLGFSVSSGVKGESGFMSESAEEPEEAEFESGVWVGEEADEAPAEVDVAENVEAARP